MPAPTARMQYTSSSFAQMLVRSSPGPRARVRKTASPGARALPRTGQFHSEVPDTVLDGAVLPAFRVGAWLLA